MVGNFRHRLVRSICYIILGAKTKTCTLISELSVDFGGDVAMIQAGYIISPVTQIWDSAIRVLSP